MSAHNLSRTAWRWVWATAAAVVLFPIIDRNPYHIDVMTTAWMNATLALGLNIVVGFTGLLQLGYAAFFAIGAYTYALLNLHAGIPFWIGLPIAGMSAAAFGFLIGLPAIRVRGDYLAIVTLGFGEIVRIIFNNLDEWTGGPNGLLGIAHPVLRYPHPADGWRWASFDFGVSSVPYYYLIILFVAFAAWASARLVRSRYGRAWAAVRDDETAARCMGINTLGVKLTAFSFSAFIAGIAGSFFAAKQGTVTPDSFDFILSVMILSMVVLGGLGVIRGAILGALILTLLPEILRGFASYRMLLFGLVMVVVMILRPQGLFGAASAGRRPPQVPAPELAPAQVRGAGEGI